MDFTLRLKLSNYVVDLVKMTIKSGNELTWEEIEWCSFKHCW